MLYSGIALMTFLFQNRRKAKFGETPRWELIIERRRGRKKKRKKVKKKMQSDS